MLYIIGVNHGYQFTGKYPSKNILLRESEKQGAEYEEPFYKWLEDFLLTNNIKLVFEEWTWEWEEAWKKEFTEPITTSAKQLAKEKNIRYEQIDPYPQPTDNELRENSWIITIRKYGKDSKNILVIIGDSHCDGIENKLLNQNYNIKVIRENELKQILIPEVYNDIRLKSF